MVSQPSLDLDSHLAILLSSFARWLPPHENEPAPTERAESIRRNVSEALAFMQIEHTFK